MPAPADSLFLRESLADQLRAREARDRATGGQRACVGVGVGRSLGVEEGLRGG